MLQCARCDEAVEDGLILCADCVVRDRLRQDARVDLDAQQTTHKAFEVPEKGRRRKTRVEATERTTSRGPSERQVWLFEHHDRIYVETTFDRDTGAVRWGPKIGDLDDQTLHSQTEKPTDE